ncbi:unnamed protein product [Cuscuta campestris]|uniref:Uncharacterized protein n=1 Tax=Cuscuta campestris TaxID=132261 RepID=A0A484NQF8_9ASTE|nr:unnamed protein product [Cuscuta campestris]
MLRDLHRGVADCGPFVEQGGLGDEIEGDLLIGHFLEGRKRKRDAARQGKSKHSSSRREDCFRLDQVVIEVEDQNEAIPEMGTVATNPLPCSMLPGSDLAGSSQRAISERPPSPPAVTYEVATESGSTRFSNPPPSPSLGDVQLETLITLPAHDRARISASSNGDLSNMVLLKLSQVSALVFFSAPFVLPSLSLPFVLYLRLFTRRLSRRSCRMRSLASQGIWRKRMVALINWRRRRPRCLPRLYPFMSMTAEENWSGLDLSQGPNDRPGENGTLERPSRNQK